MPPNGASASRAVHGRSWMLPEAKRSSLLYVGDPGSGGVLVYTYLLP
jgi:hypothetical protein